MSESYHDWGWLKQISGDFGDGGWSFMLIKHEDFELKTMNYIIVFKKLTTSKNSLS